MIAPASAQSDRAPALQSIALAVLAQEIDSLLGQSDPVSFFSASDSSETTNNQRQPSATSLHA